MTEITWFGHSAFKISDGKVSVVVDPFFDGNPQCPIAASEVGAVDIVLVTHDHGDHLGQAVQVCHESGAMLGAIVEVAENLMQKGLASEQILNGIGFNLGGTLEHKGIHMTMVHAYHSSNAGVPVGYIIRMPDGTTIYHAGDTCVFKDMALWGSLYPLNIALLPIGGVFTMDALQAATACALLQTKKVIPMHWGTFPMLAQSTDDFKRQLARVAPACACVDLRPGQTMTV